MTLLPERKITEPFEQLIAEQLLSLNCSVNFASFSMAIKQDISMTGITGVFGHSGSGKSTLLRAIAGLEQAAIGSITLGEQILLNSAQRIKLKPEQRGVGLVFQNSRLFPHLTVLDNLRFATKRAPSNQLNIHDILALTELESFQHVAVDTLSGGQQQRVALARAILGEPKLLLLDEPLSALDQQAKTQLLNLIVKVQKQLNLPILYISHSVDELQQVCDKLLVLSQGKVVHYGNIHQVIHQLNTPQVNSKNQQLIKPQTSLSLPIICRDNNHGLAILALGKQQIYLASDTIAQQVNTEHNHVLRCFILASDISICLTEPINSSIVNQLKGKIKAIWQHNSYVLVTVNCDGQDFFVNISAYSQQKLALSISQQVYLQFKASAVRTFLY